MLYALEVIIYMLNSEYTTHNCLEYKIGMIKDLKWTHCKYIDDMSLEDAWCTNYVDASSAIIAKEAQ